MRLGRIPFWTWTIEKCKGEIDVGVDFLYVESMMDVNHIKLDLIGQDLKLPFPELFHPLPGLQSRR